jgi:predicted neutral ceramidase superfamily lipid hydrolase
MLNESQTFKMFKQLIKTFSLILFIALCLCLNFTKNTMILSILIIIMMTYIMLKPTKI